jgi:hypothetical protein
MSDVVLSQPILSYNICRNFFENLGVKVPWKEQVRVFLPKFVKAVWTFPEDQFVQIKGFHAVYSLPHVIGRKNTVSLVNF